MGYRHGEQAAEVRHRHRGPGLRVRWQGKQRLGLAWKGNRLGAGTVGARVGGADTGMEGKQHGEQAVRGSPKRGR